MIGWLYKRIHWYKVASLEIKELREEVAAWKSACAVKQAEIQVLTTIIEQLRYYSGRHTRN